MYTRNSFHVNSLRRKASSYFPRSDNDPTKFRPALNVKKFVKCLKQLALKKEELSVPLNNPQKRSRSVSPVPAGNPSKRRKASPSVSEASELSVVDAEGENEKVGEDNAMAGAEDGLGENSSSFIYPIIRDHEGPFSLREGDADSEDANRHIPVFRHTLELQYTTDILDGDVQKDYVEDHVAEKCGWVAEEVDMLTALKQLGVNATDPLSFDLGRIWLCCHRGRYVALSEPPGIPGQVESDKWLCIVPSIPWPNQVDFDAEDYSPSEMHNDMLMAFSILGHMGRVTVQTRLRLIVLPLSVYDPSSREFPFRLQVDMTASLVTPTIYEPMSFQGYTKRDVAEREDAQRRFLSLVYPQPGPSFTTTDVNTTNLPFLYSILVSAPRLSFLLDQHMQPDALLPTLLPFQRRSVGWMLERENKIVDPKGAVITKPLDGNIANNSLPLFWNKIKQGNSQVCYIHHLTGSLALELPTQNVSLGGILAEEPGLGKTLECIALILLNPAPWRNPSISRWDEGAKITLKEIKTTLIVTPPALASQWADEIALHSPSLRVFIYEGWSKVRVPITARDVQIERERLRNGGKPKSRISSKNPTRKSETSAKKDKGRVDASKMEDEPMDVDDQLDSPSNSKTPESGEEILDWCSFINTFDICITTYSTLRLDLGVARPIPSRPRREDVIYANLEKPRSPLVMCEWHRVIMDEVQMVGAGKIEEMVSLIPRISSWAVSGTPARAQLSDLKHVLKFLRVDHLVEPARVWNRLLKPAFANQFSELFRQFAIRTLKSSVKDELTIPQQTRYLVGIELGPVERHIYDQNLESALLDLGLDARGVAASAGWDVDTTLLRSLLRKLRGICTHPQVGQLKQGDKLLKGSKGGALKSIGEVLDGMRDQNWRTLMDDRKSRVQTFIQRAQLQQHEDGNRTRYQDALETLMLAEKEAGKLIAKVERAIMEHNEKGEILKKAADALKEPTNLEQDAVAIDVIDKGKGRALERNLSPDSEADSEDHDLPRTPAGQEHGVKTRALRQRLRESRVVLHRVKFLQGDVYHVLGKTHSDAEDKAYAAAEEIRRDLLKSTEEAATRAMSSLLKDAAAKGLTKEILLVKCPFLDENGDEKSGHLIDEANDIIENLLNEQSELLWEWRTRMHSLLTQSLKSDNADGEEYAKSLDAQGEADMYLQAYTSLMADRRAALVAERTLLAEHDGKEKKLRKTKAAKDAAAAAAAIHAMHNPDLPEDFELRPEHEVLFKDLTTTRRGLLEGFDGRAIKSIIVELNAINVTLKDKHPEKDIIKKTLSELRRLMTDQARVMEKLDTDVVQFRKAFNERILYFRQLQEISDSVTEVNWDNDVAEAIEGCDFERRGLEAKINTNRARQRFLDNLAQSTADGLADEDEEGCILCRCEFTRGYITPCAHVFCEPCMNAWVVKKEGKTCPVCRVIFKSEQLQRFTVKDQKPEEPAPLVPKNNEPAPKTRREIQYNRIDPQLFEDIQTMESFGSYGSKIQALVRHIRFLQLTDPGAKSIVFSAWADSLQIIEHALITNKIPCLRIDQARGGENAAKRFRSDPNLLVLLLHGERENAGLNVTCASRVFLVESVVHHGFEVQAIARIDRMGQTRPTEDTVEKNILDLAARQGLSLYTQDNSAGTLNTTPFALDAEKKPADSPSKKKKAQKGDEISKTDDMLAILFPHMFFYEDYMDVTEKTTAGGPTDDGASACQDSVFSRDVTQHVNAVAGPSRLG